MTRRYRRRFWHRALPKGLSFTGEVHNASQVEFIADKTWVDDNGNRHSEQHIFDAAFDLIEKSRRFLLLDMFLYNDFQGKEQETTRLLSGELTDRLVEHSRRNPHMKIVVITDPINTVYGSLPSKQFRRLEEAGIDVVMTDLRKLRDPNPLYSIFWRALIRPFGNSTRGRLPSPFGRRDKVTVRSYLEAFNFKANHRKVLIADDGDDWSALVTSANPHDASSAHTNVALSFNGPAVWDLLQTENAVLQLSGREAADVQVEAPAQAPGTSVQVLTERAIKQAALRIIEGCRRNERLSLATFYLSDRDIIGALKLARRREVALRVLLDPNKDAFGNPKFGIPNRAVAHELRNAGVEVRWVHTHGEQCHTKMILHENMSAEALTLLGSANLTRRNLDNFNLETNVLVRTQATTKVFKDAKFHFDL
ncbi:MAG: phospholipase D-like domain-containing protein, partial [Gammaproteobacteria bacterium]|nr:phospholipase D-like domain-containing protein [Gammaproteobacteria bacterium]